MSPNSNQTPGPLKPIESSEEVVVGEAGQEEMVRRETRTPDQQQREYSVRTATPTGSSVQRKTTTTPSAEAVRDFSRKREVFHANRIIWYVLGLIEVLLAFRFFLKATAANPNSGFAQFIYGFSNIFAGPFSALYPQTRVAPTSGSIVEWSTIIAGFVYLLIAWGIVYLLQLYKPTRPEEIEYRVEQGI